MRRLVLTLAFVGACGGVPETQTADSTERYAYVDANPDAPFDPHARAKLQEALAALDAAAHDHEAELSRALAGGTLERITSGAVRIGSIEGARGPDRWHMCRDYELGACDGAPTDDAAWLGDDEVAETLANELDGYMWGNRLYFTFRDETDPVELAATLVHEVNHILNRSECSYYLDIDTHEVDDTRAYVEEYRAFFTECFFGEDAGAALDSCNDHSVESVDGYGFHPTLGDVLPEGAELGELVYAGELGPMVPTPALWPASFDACGCDGAEFDDAGVCRLPNGRFAAAVCCDPA